MPKFNVSLSVMHPAWVDVTIEADSVKEAIAKAEAIPAYGLLWTSGVVDRHAETFVESVKDEDGNDIEEEAFA